MGARGWGLLGAVLLVVLALLAGCDTPPLKPTPVLIPSPVPLTATPMASPTVPPIAGRLVVVVPPPLPQPTQVPIYQIGSLSFSDVQHGWVLGTTCTPDHSCSIAVRATSDSGESWSPLAPGPHDASAVTLVSADVGWVYNPGLFVTRDGGKTWRDDSPGVTVVAIAPFGQSVWALETFCATDGSCPLLLRTSSNQGLSWENHPIPLPILGPSAQFVRRSAQDAWVLSDGGLAATHDGGKTWQPLPAPPCGSYRRNFSGVGAGQLWVICGSAGATDMEKKLIYASQDGGNHWKVVAESQPEGLANFPAVGHVDSLVVTAPAHAWAVLQRGTLMRTLNNGKTWDAAMAYDIPNPGDAFYGPLTYIDDLHLWLAAQGRVFRTTNGGATWDEREVFPPWNPPGLR